MALPGANELREEITVIKTLHYSENKLKEMTGNHYIEIQK